jgi:hypothetical protein
MTLGGLNRSGLIDIELCQLQVANVSQVKYVKLNPTRFLELKGPFPSNLALLGATVVCHL